MSAKVSLYIGDIEQTKIVKISEQDVLINCTEKLYTVLCSDNKFLSCAINFKNKFSLTPISFLIYGVTQKLETGGILVLLNADASINNIIFQFLGNIGFVDIEFKLNSISAVKINKIENKNFKPELNEIYNKMAIRYDQVVENGKYQGINWLADEMKAISNLSPKILDLGCGNGIAGDKLFKIGFQPKMFGIDFSQEIISMTQNKGKYAGLICADLATSFPVFENDEFDFVIALGVLEFLPEAKRFLASIYKTLKINGELFITFEVTNENSLPSGTLIEPYGYKKVHHSQSIVEEMIESIGYKIKKIKIDDAYYSPSLNRNVPYIFARLEK